MLDQAGILVLPACTPGKMFRFAEVSLYHRAQVVRALHRYRRPFAISVIDLSRVRDATVAIYDNTASLFARLRARSASTAGDLESLPAHHRRRPGRPDWGRS